MPSVEPSSVTTSSRGSKVCCSRLFNCSGSSFSPLYVAMATEICAPCDCPPPGVFPTACTSVWSSWLSSIYCSERPDSFNRRSRHLGPECKGYER